MAMELRALFLLPLCFPGLQGQTPKALRQREGDTLYIKCPYTRTESGRPKYWCLLAPDGVNREIASTYYGSKDKRITIKDDTSGKTVSITMTDLRAEDSGTYFCASYNCYYFIPPTRISLNVFKDLLRWELDTLSVQCPNMNGMVWCRREETGCTVLAERQTPSKRGAMKSLQDARASITYNTPDVLTVTMEKLHTSDSGVYWCALGPERTQIREVVLSVFKRTQQHTVKESGNVSVHCHYKIADYRAVSKAWCKKEEKMCKVLAATSSELPVEPSVDREGVRIQDDTQQGIVTVTMEQLQGQDSGVYWCALQERSGLVRMEEVTLNVSRALAPGAFPDTESESEDTLFGDSPEPSSSGNTLIILSVVLFILFLLALITSIALGVRHYKLLRKSGNTEAEDTGDRAEGTAQPGSTGRRGSSQDDTKGPAYINLDVQSQPRPEDPLYCNVEPGQAHRNPQHVEYAIIAFNQSPRNGRE